MAPPSKLEIATSAVNRLIKDKASYSKEQNQQEARIRRLETETGDENAGYMLEQERKALLETKAMYANMDKTIANAAQNLKDQLAADETSAPGELVTKAKEMLAVAAST